MPADPHWQPFPPGFINARIPIEGAAAMTPDPTSACEQDAATIDDLRERIDRLEARDPDPGAYYANLRAERDHFRQRAIDAEAKVARVETLADEYDANTNWREWGVGRAIRAALSAANPADVSAPHPDAQSGSGGRMEGEAGR